MSLKTIFLILAILAVGQPPAILANYELYEKNSLFISAEDWKVIRHLDLLENMDLLAYDNLEIFKDFLYAKSDHTRYCKK